MKSCSILLFSLSLTLEVFDVGGKYLLVDVSAKGSKIPPVVPRPECIQDSDCTGDSDTCVEGQCQCGTIPGVCGRTSSPFPTMCINGDCVTKPVEPEKCLVKGAICHPDDVPPYVCCKGLSCENDPLQKLFRCTEKEAYYLTGVNELCAENEIGTLEKCKEAVHGIKDEIPHARFGSTGNYPKYPKGCFLFVFDNANKDKLYFNENPTGSSSEDARHVCGNTGPKPGPKPGPKTLPTKPPMICKTDEDCKVGEICVTFMGMPIGCIPADGPIPIPPKKECPECCKRGCQLLDCVVPEICPRPEPKEPKVAARSCEGKLPKGAKCWFNYECCDPYKCEGFPGWRKCELD